MTNYEDKMSSCKIDSPLHTLSPQKEEICLYKLIHSINSYIGTLFKGLYVTMNKVEGTSFLMVLYSTEKKQTNNK